MPIPVSALALTWLPKIPDSRGNLSFIEADNHVPFAIRRAYWLYDVPGGALRMGHAYRQQQEFIVAISGSFDVVLQDEKETRKIQLNRSYYGLLIPAMTWRSLENFSTNSLALILSDTSFDETDYIRDIDLYLQLRHETI
ncbi:MAG TPA: FdtA/QdtA family cupin domain-containing protein [Panacibacter sp.]|nr:FdtA/QdtA family cupin domain-containing protein [Panacibacter sp.]HNP46557.1 FdtA/QdtA family cupin domain-containing protein [Panacibacter sp.]